MVAGYPCFANLIKYQPSRRFAKQWNYNTPFKPKRYLKAVSFNMVKTCFVHECCLLLSLTLLVSFALTVCFLKDNSLWIFCNFLKTSCILLFSMEIREYTIITTTIYSRFSMFLFYRLFIYYT